MGILPNKKRSPVIDIRTLNVLVFGIPGVGKSTLASQSPDALFFATEDGLKSMEVMEYRCQNWKDIEDGFKELKSYAGDPGRPWKTVAIDTIDNWIMMGANRVCKERGWDHEGLGDHGLGYGLVNKKIKGSLINISNLRDENGKPAYGLWMISHTKELTTKVRGEDRTKIVPSMSDSQRRIVEGFADLILYMDTEWNEDLKQYQRVIRTKPTAHYIAKDRTGRLPETIVFPDPSETPSGYDIIRELIHGKGTDPKPPRSSRKPQAMDREKLAEPFPEDDPGEPEDFQDYPGNMEEPGEDGPLDDGPDPFAEDLSDEDMGDPPADMMEDEVEVHEPPEEPDPPKKPTKGKGNGKTSGFPGWADKAWETLSEMPEKGRIKYLRDQLAEVMDDDSVCWEEGWFKDNEKQINQVHERYVLRQAEKKNLALQELREKGEKKS